MLMAKTCFVLSKTSCPVLVYNNSSHNVFWIPWTTAVDDERFSKIKMQFATVLCMLIVVGFAAAEDKYTDRYDNVNVREVINNKRLLIAYLECILDDKAKCTPEARELKSNIKEALETYCKKCTKVQFDWTRVVIGHLINNEPAYWEKLVTKYDPDRKYTVKYEKELKTLKA